MNQPSFYHRCQHDRNRCSVLADAPLCSSCLHIAEISAERFQHIYHLSYYFVPGKDAKYCHQRVCMSFCLSVCARVSKTTLPTFTRFSVNAACGRGSILIWRQCDMLCTSGFVDDVMLSHNRENRPNRRRCFRPNRHVAAPGAKLVPIFTARRYASTVYYMLLSSDCPSVCPSNASIVPKWLNAGPRKQCQTHEL